MMPDDLPEFDSDALPNAGAADDLILEAYKRRAERRLVDELLDVIRRANAPRPLVILEREQADFLRNLMLDLIAGKEGVKPLKVPLLKGRAVSL